MPPLYQIMAFIAGTLFGSFFHTLALRYIDGSMAENPLRALFSSSRCPACKSRVRAAGLIPLAGYIFLRGRCSSCGQKISPAYPLSEIVHGMLMLTCVILWGITPHAFCLFLAVSVTIAITHIDLRTMTVPDSLVVAFFLSGVYPALTDHMAMQGFYGFLVMFLFFSVILLLFPGSFGGGDIKYASAMGFLLGPAMSVVALEAALVTGAVAGIIYARISKKSLKTRIPFGPFLSAGYIVALVWGADLVLVWERLTV